MAALFFLFLDEKWKVSKIPAFSCKLHPKIRLHLFVLNKSCIICVKCFVTSFLLSYPDKPRDSSATSIYRNKLRQQSRQQQTVMTTFAFDVGCCFHAILLHTYLLIYIWWGYHTTAIFIPTIHILINCISKEFLSFVTSLLMDCTSKSLDQKFSVDSGRNKSYFI